MTPRMRTIEKAYEHITTLDPETQLTKTAFKQLVKSGEIVSVSVGRKLLVNLDAVEKYLSCGIEPSEPTPTTSTAIPENGEIVFKLVKGA